MCISQTRIIMMMTAVGMLPHFVGDSYVQSSIASLCGEYIY